MFECRSIATYQRLFFESRPALQLTFAFDRRFAGRMAFRIDHANRSPLRGVRAATSFVVGLSATLHIVGVPDVKRVVRATQDVDERHTRRPFDSLRSLRAFASARERPDMKVARHERGRPAVLR